MNGTETDMQNGSINYLMTTSVSTRGQSSKPPNPDDKTHVVELKKCDEMLAFWSHDRLSPDNRNVFPEPNTSTSLRCIWSSQSDLICTEHLS